MRKIVAGLFVSLDGVVESPERWAFPFFDDQLGQALGAGMAQADTILLGRRTYQEFAAYWPHQGSDVPFADWTNTTPKLVASGSLKSVAWQNSRLLTGSLVDALTGLKQQPGKDIRVIGSGTLVRWLIRHQLLDELGLLVPPVLVGTGKHLFEGGSEQTPLKLVDSKALSTGVLALTYQPA